MSDTKIIEINGVKFEVDARTATMREISTVRVGSKVKILQDNEVYHGVVIGFDPFQKSPVVIICYMNAKTSYWSSPELKFLYYKHDSKEQVVVSPDDDGPSLEKEAVIVGFDREINKKKREIEELEDKKSYFLRNFASYWQMLCPVKEEV